MDTEFSILFHGISLWPMKTHLALISAKTKMKFSPIQPNSEIMEIDIFLMISYGIIFTYKCTFISCIFLFCILY